MKTKWLWLVGPWALFLTLAIGWVIYWHVLAGEAERRIGAFVTEQRAQGAEIDIGAIERHGFPAMLRLSLRDVVYSPARAGWRADAAHIDMHLQPFNTEHVIFEAEAPISIARANGAVTTISADALIASIRTRRGALAQAGVEADALVLDDASQEGVLAAQKLVINIRPDARAPGDYQMAFELRSATLPRPVRSFESFGLDVPLMRAAIVVERAEALLAAAPEDPLGPWREAGGRLRFEALQLNWGPLEASGSGAGGLDAQRRLAGELEFALERPAPVFTAIANGDNVDEDARRALAILAAGYALTGDDIELDVSAGDGALRLAGVEVRVLGPVY